ncbi:palmitoyl-protein thioesterase 1-like protein [Tanacetum coccineum]|uniref:Palmitoyl-protein thioesterase 1-like protein n=1 Tax=Tanacetum coccineum TaxID=301880 RepID=A0ABQ4WB41_9ASTR
MEGRPYARRLSKDEYQLVEDLTKKNVEPRYCLQTIKKKGDWESFISAWNLLQDSPTWMSYLENYEQLQSVLEKYPRELHRLNDPGFDYSLCGCHLRRRCGLCSIDIFWRTLDVSWSKPLEHEDIQCEDELHIFNENFNKQSKAGKRSFLRKLELQDVIGDGNCGFRSVAVALGLPQDQWPRIRSDLVSELDRKEGRKSKSEKDDDVNNVDDDVPSLIFLSSFHRIGDQCSNKGMTQFTQQLSNLSNSQGFCIEIGDGACDSWFMSLLQQTEAVCKVKNMHQLANGYNIVGLSQGNLIGRGVVEFCDGAPQASGPHAGTASVPLCGSGIFCKIADALIKSEIYSDYIQEHLAPSGYLKLPNNMDAYLKHCSFLPKLNNEIPEERNSTYKERFSSLENLVLIMFEQDTVVIPKETAWFGYFPYGEFSPVLATQQTKLYIEDWIGLKTLDEAGRVKYINVTGNHLGISNTDIEKYVVPYLKDSEQDIIRTDDKDTKQVGLERYSSYTWPSSIRSLFNDLLGLADVNI